MNTTAQMTDSQLEIALAINESIAMLYADKNLSQLFEQLLLSCAVPLDADAFATCPGKPVAERFECSFDDVEAAFNELTAEGDLTTVPAERKSGEYPIANIPNGVPETLDWMRHQGIDTDAHVIGLVTGPDGKPMAAGWVLEIELPAEQRALAS